METPSIIVTSLIDGLCVNNAKFTSRLVCYSLLGLLDGQAFMLLLPVWSLCLTWTDILFLVWQMELFNIKSLQRMYIETRIPVDENTRHMTPTETLVGREGCLSTRPGWNVSSGLTMAVRVLVGDGEPGRSAEGGQELAQLLLGFSLHNSSTDRTRASQ